MRIMYEVIKPGTYGTDGFNAEVLIFTADPEIARRQAILHSAELWEIQYEGDSWKRWKESKIQEYNKRQLSLL